MSFPKITTATTLALGVVLAMAGSVRAMTIQQSESSSQSFDVSVSGGTTTDTTVHTSGQQSSSQSQTVDTAPDQSIRYVWPRAQYSWRGRHIRPARVYSNWVTPAVLTDGQVRLSWDYRGGTCQIRYGEAARGGYAYSTSAGCDDGGVTIGGLQPGLRYRFQVKPDNGMDWSQPMVVRAE